MEQYSLVYIDDKPEAALTKYLCEELHVNNLEIECSEIIFKPEEGYESLLSDSRVKAANIILIDSLLFENRTAREGKFTGEEFKFVLKKFYPYIEVIVITQNDIESDIDKLAKYDRNCGKTAFEYYSGILPERIRIAVRNIKQYRKLAELVAENDSWDKALKDRVFATLNGIDTYDKMTKSDIDNLIELFKEIQRSLNG